MAINSDNVLNDEIVIGLVHDTKDKKTAMRKMTQNIAVWLTSMICFALILATVKFFVDREIKEPVHRPEINTTYKTPPKLILVYNTLWGNRLWTGMETTQKWNNWGGIPCKVRNCHVTYRKDRLGEADVVLFHAFGSDMLSQRKIKKIQKYRNPNSYWIYFVHECPENILPDPNLYNGFFNWTMSYRTDADFYVPYNWESGHWEARGINDPKVVLKNHAEDKDKFVYAAISHCGCTRELYIKKLKEYINVDVYGACGHVFNDSNKVCKRGSPQCSAILKRYKFYLAFENSFCEDYASEKFFNTILEGHTVPIVMGGANYKKIGLPNSYIDVNDYSTIEELANYLKYLDDNDAAYNKYFEYKKFFKLGPPRSWSCKICEKINAPDLKPKSYLDLGDWFSRYNQCGTKLTDLRKIMHRSDVPHPYTDDYYKHEDMFF